MPLKAKDIRVLGNEEMDKKINDAHRSLLDMRFKAATKQIKNHREIPQTKRDVARMKTIKRERELGIRQD
jgi:large subunit ribosomal protein L29